MTTKYASARGKAEDQLRRAREDLTQTRALLTSAEARNMKSEAARAKWVETYPGRAEREPDRPYFSGNRGHAVTVEGIPITYESAGQEIPSAPDLTVGPPLTSNTMDALESAVVDAEKTLAKAEKAAAEVKPETQKATGYEVAKSGRIAGTYYMAGDPISPSVVDARKFDQFLRVGLVARVGHG